MKTKSTDSSSPDRRSFFKEAGGLAAGVALVGACQNSQGKEEASEAIPAPLSTNTYPWMTFYRRSGEQLNETSPEFLTKVKESGADHLEPILKSLEFVDALSDALEKQGIGMQSAYVNSELFDREKAKGSVDEVMALARRAKARMGTRIFVTNPSPVRWGGQEDKTDEQLEVQRDALEELGQAIHSEGMQLAYHFHAPEFRQGAREVHHMLSATNPKYVKLCLDAHWAFRGAGDSNVALHDIVRLYGDRIVELHVRQSKGGIWTEAFGEGDIDYHRLTRELEGLGISPLVTMEQAVEKTSPETMDALEAHRSSHAAAREVFAPFIG